MAPSFDDWVWFFRWVVHQDICIYKKISCWLYTIMFIWSSDMALDLVGKYPDLEWMKPKSVGRVLNKIAVKATTFDGDNHLKFWKRFIYWCEYLINSVFWRFCFWVLHEIEGVLKMDGKSQSFDVENQTSLGKWAMFTSKNNLTLLFLTIWFWCRAFKVARACPNTALNSLSSYQILR